MNEMKITKNERFRFSTKAQTLSSLDGRLISSILPSCVITWEEWCQSKTMFLERVRSQLGIGPFIVRSSCSKENTDDASVANSHKAIRAHELGIPAAIGTGGKLYSSWSKAQQIRIDCVN